jgi:hypothetical protein
MAEPVEETSMDLAALQAYMGGSRTGAARRLQEERPGEHIAPRRSAYSPTTNHLKLIYAVGIGCTEDVFTYELAGPESEDGERNPHVSRAALALSERSKR